MPTIWNNEIGATASVRSLLTDSLAQVVDGQAHDVLSKIRLVNTSSGSVSVDLSIFDGTTHHYLAKGQAVPANDAIEIWDEQLLVSQKLHARAGSADVVWLHATCGLRGMR